MLDHSLFMPAMTAVKSINMQRPATAVVLAQGFAPRGRCSSEDFEIHEIGGPNGLWLVLRCVAIPTFFLRVVLHVSQRDMNPD